ncbi:MAG: RHS repeat-associated core domain-containing protein [Chloracidobacterium sp.]|nr:RHS repeat-associated core domain-containing protein [Chloracidobacterium sp.]
MGIVRAFRKQSFNPVVLTEIELPTGQKYKFTYNIFGLIERITYPTGGSESFVHNTVAPLTSGGPENVTDQTNFGVTNRKVYETSGLGTTYEWNYTATHVAPSGYKVSVISPDQTVSEKLLYQGYGSCIGCSNGTFGYENGLAGMPYEELAFDSASPARLVSRKLTRWIKKTFSSGLVTADWHPRVDHEESVIYDSNGNGVSTTTKYEFEGDLNQRETPLLINKTTQYAFVPIQGSSNFGGESFAPGEPPEPNPTPIPTPNPASLTPVRSSELTYLINDSANFPAWVREIYKSKNIVGLSVASVVRGADNTIVARTETKYDDGALSPEIGRGNPTTARVWDSTKGASTNPDSYISTHAKFDSYGNQVETTDARGNVSRTEYSDNFSDGIVRNSFAFPTKTISAIPDPSGTYGSITAFETTVKYDFATGLPISTTDANGRETRIEYDPVTLRLLRTKYYHSGIQIGGTSEVSYNDEPGNIWIKNRTQITSSDWTQTITYFDGLRRAWKSEQADSNGNIFVEKEFDSEGRVKRVTSPFRNQEVKNWTTNVYDEAGRVKEVIAPDGTKIQTNYSVAISGSQIGTVVTVMDQAGKQLRSINNVLGQLTRVDEPDLSNQLGNLDNPSQPTFYKYNGIGKMTHVQQGIQNRYFLYDSLGRLLRIRQPEQGTNASLTTSGNPDNNVWSAGFTYDDNGNMLTSTDTNNVSVLSSFDNLSRVQTRTYTDSTPPVSFKYDNLQFAKGKLIEVSSSVSSSKSTQFNSLGDVLTYQQITDNQTFTSGFQYNAFGVLTSETYPSGRQVSYEFNVDGDLSRVSGQNGPTQQTYANSFSFDASGSVQRLRLGNGKWETAKFNNRNQVTELGLGNSSTDASIWRTNFEYGDVQSNGTVDGSKNTGNIGKQTLSLPGVVNPIVQTFKYDSLDRLVEAEEKTNNQQSWIQQFGYDRYGNRNTFNQLIGQISQNLTPTIDQSTNRFVAGQGFIYDLSGNVIRDVEGRQFTFNGDNKQVKVMDSQNSVIGEYFYDGEGKRVKKVTNLETTIFVYAAGKLIAEYSTQPVQNPTISYTTTDHLGSPRIITDAYGQVSSRRDFMPFGEELGAGIGNRTTGQKYSLSGIDNVRQRFTGYEKDSETGLDFAEARYYSNTHGRFTAVDPLIASGQSANPQTYNRYVYVGNNPVNIIDPTGLEWYMKKGSNQPEWFDKDPGDEYEKAPHIYWAGEGYGWVVLDYNSNHWQGYFEEREDALTFYDQPSDYSLFDGVNEMMDVFDVVSLGGGTIRLGLRHGIKKLVKEGGELLIEKSSVALLREAAEKELKAAGKAVTKLAVNGIVGEAAERLVKELLQKEGFTVLGSKVAVRVADGPKGLRFVDHLVQTPAGEIVAYEVKSGGGTRNAAQMGKDNIMETVGGKIIGKNAPDNLLDTTRKIRTVEVKIK